MMVIKTVGFTFTTFGMLLEMKTRVFCINHEEMRLCVHTAQGTEMKKSRSSLVFSIYTEVPSLHLRSLSFKCCNFFHL